jgi:hypothetical protein
MVALWYERSVELSLEPEWQGSFRRLFTFRRLFKRMTGVNCVDSKTQVRLSCARAPS